MEPLKGNFELDVAERMEEDIRMGIDQSVMSDIEYEIWLIENGTEATDEDRRSGEVEDVTKEVEKDRRESGDYDVLPGIRERVQLSVNSQIQADTGNEIQKKVENGEYSKGLTRGELMLLQHFSDLTQPVQDFLENNADVTESYMSKGKTGFSFSYNGTPFNIALVGTTEYRINTNGVRVHREHIIPFVGIADWFASQGQIDPTNIDIINPKDSPLLRMIIKDNFKVSESFEGNEDFSRVTCSEIDGKLTLRCYTKQYAYRVCEIRL